VELRVNDNDITDEQYRVHSNDRMWYFNGQALFNVTVFKHWRWGKLNVVENQLTEEIGGYSKVVGELVVDEKFLYDDEFISRHVIEYSIERKDADLINKDIRLSSLGSISVTPTMLQYPFNSVEELEIVTNDNNALLSSFNAGRFAIKFGDFDITDQCRFVDFTHFSCQLLHFSYREVESVNIVISVAGILIPGYYGELGIYQGQLLLQERQPDESFPNDMPFDDRIAQLVSIFEQNISVDSKWRVFTIQEDEIITQEEEIVEDNDIRVVEEYNIPSFVNKDVEHKYESGEWALIKEDIEENSQLSSWWVPSYYHNETYLKQPFLSALSAIGDIQVFKIDKSNPTWNTLLGPHSPDLNNLSTQNQIITPEFPLILSNPDISNIKCKFISKDSSNTILYSQAELQNGNLICPFNFDYYTTITNSKITVFNLNIIHYLSPDITKEYPIAPKTPSSSSYPNLQSALTNGAIIVINSLSSLTIPDSSKIASFHSTKMVINFIYQIPATERAVFTQLIHEQFLGTKIYTENKNSLVQKRRKERGMLTAATSGLDIEIELDMDDPFYSSAVSICCVIFLGYVFF
jgi:hypothetical protein